MSLWVHGMFLQAGLCSASPLRTDLQYSIHARACTLPLLPASKGYGLQLFCKLSWQR